jgi:hypothetical protein
MSFDFKIKKEIIFEIVSIEFEDNSYVSFLGEGNFLIIVTI